MKMCTVCGVLELFARKTYCVDEGRDLGFKRPAPWMVASQRHIFQTQTERQEFLRVMNLDHVQRHMIISLC